ncbi:MAG: M48 family peptidase [Niabella sp.]|nr:MAG: M48 family peptidase [Niabella sp.]
MLADFAPAAQNPIKISPNCVYSNKISTDIIFKIIPPKSLPKNLFGKLVRKYRLFARKFDPNCPENIKIIVVKRKKRSRMKSRKNYLQNREYARKIIVRTVDDIAKKHGFSYNKIAIKNQKTRLGSCSSKKNLNFNWQIIKFPKPIMEYVIKHELAHLNEPNHSERYWLEVQKIDRSYRKHHEWIRENAYKYID